VFIGRAQESFAHAVATGGNMRAIEIIQSWIQSLRDLVGQIDRKDSATRRAVQRHRKSTDPQISSEFQNRFWLDCLHQRRQREVVGVISHVSQVSPDTGQPDRLHFIIVQAAQQFLQSERFYLRMSVEPQTPARSACLQGKALSLRMETVQTKDLDQVCEPGYSSGNF